jgi:predicted SprT family Zn-dependent metalloprotease
MTLQDAEKMFYSLAHSYGLYGYKFEFDRRRKKFNRTGSCNPRTRTIKLQPMFFELNYPVVVKWTILHEIAHAFNPKNHHGKFWKESAKTLGHSGNTCCGDYVKIK